MAAVHVGISHQNNAIVAQSTDIKALANAGAQRRDQRLDLFIGQRFIQAGLFDVEDLAAQGQNGLEAPIAALLGGAAGAIALDNVNLALGGVAAGAVGQLARQRQAFQRALADDQIAGLLGCFPGAEGGATLLNNLARLARILFHPLAHGLGHSSLYVITHLVVEQLEFVLPFKLRLDDLNAHNGGEPLTRIIAGKVGVVIFEEALLARIVVDQPGERRAQTGEMRAAIGCIDGVGKGKGRF